VDKSAKAFNMTCSLAQTRYGGGAFGIRIHYFPYTVHTSSTQLRRALAAATKAQLGHLGS